MKIEFQRILVLELKFDVKNEKFEFDVQTLEIRIFEKFEKHSTKCDNFR